MQAAVAWWATGLQHSVVSNALAIASFATGILLGLFLLGILTRRVGPAGGPDRHGVGVRAVSFAKFGTPLAWPWFALVGSSTVFVVGLAQPACSSPAPGLESRPYGHLESRSNVLRREIMTLEDHLLTEARNPRSEAIDTLDAAEIVALMNAEDARVVEAVRAEAAPIARADRVDRRSVPARRAADLRRGRDLRPAGRARRLRVPADVQHAAGDGRRPDRRRTRRR